MLHAQYIFNHLNLFSVCFSAKTRLFLCTFQQLTWNFKCWTKTCCGYFLGNFLKKLGHFLFPHLVTLYRTARDTFLKLEALWFMQHKYQSFNFRASLMCDIQGQVKLEHNWSEYKKTFAILCLSGSLIQKPKLHHSWVIKAWKWGDNVINKL